MIGFNASALNFFASSGLGIQTKSHKPIAKIGVGPSLDDARATHKRIKSDTNSVANSNKNSNLNLNLGINSSTNSQISNSNSSINLNSHSNSNAQISAKFLVTDKSQAVGTSLGYGIDKDGYYTSDFNETAGIPSDYKIHSSTMESLARIRENNRAHACEVFKSIDIAQSIGNAYKILSQVVGDEILNLKSSFTMDEIKGFPQGYKYTKATLNVNKTYEINDFMSEISRFEQNNKTDMGAEHMSFLFFNQSLQTSGASKPTSNIFDNNNSGQESELGGLFWATTASKYTNADGTISKGGLLIGVLNENSWLVEEETEHIEIESIVQESGNDDEWLKNYKSPLMQMLEEILKLQKELAKKALKKRLDTAQQKVDIKA